MGINSLIREIQEQLKSFDTSSLLFHAKIPVEKHIIKKNSRPIHRHGSRPFIGKSAELKRGENFLRQQLLLNAWEQKIQKPIECELQAIYHFHHGPEISRSYALSDLSNLIEIVSDSLQTTKRQAGVILNDRQIKSLDGTRKFKNSTTYLEVFLLKFDENTDLIKKP